MKKLPGDYIAGFVDGEGCFALKFRRDVRHDRNGTPEYLYWGIEFAIVLREDDREILEKIKTTLGCGNFSSTHGSIRYSVTRFDDLLYKVVPFFEKYELRAKKAHDFKLWKEALVLLHKNKGKKTGLRATGHRRGNRKEIWDPTELNQLKEIHNAMGQYKSKSKPWKWLE